MKIFAVTQKGPNKAENEDRIIVGNSVLVDGAAVFEMEYGLLAIADGVGGCNAGAVASQFVAERICNLSDITPEAMEKINRDLLLQSEQNPEQAGMATTLSGVLLSDSKAQLFSVGNARVYMVCGGKYLKQLTIDDTTLQYLLSSGQLSEKEVEVFDRKNEITACFGGGNSNLFRIKVQELAPIAAPVLITSDGIHDTLSIDEMEEILAEFGISEKTCEVMIASARAQGSCDDASILLGGI